MLINASRTGGHCMFVLGVKLSDKLREREREREREKDSWISKLKLGGSKGN